MRAAQRRAHRPAQLFADVVAGDPAARSVSEDGGFVCFVGFGANDDHASAREAAAGGTLTSVKG